MRAAQESYRTGRLRAMNTEIEYAFSEEGLELAEVGRWTEEIALWFAYVERTFSRFLPDSELSRLNRAGGRPVFVSATMHEVLQRSEQFRRATGGLFEPFVLPALEQAGYAVSFERLSAQQQTRRPQTALPAECAKAGLQLNPGLRTACIQGGGKLDLGGIAKGWAVQRLAGWMRESGIRSGMVGAGGDLCVWGGSTDPWEVTIADPWDASATIAAVRLARGAAATSSVLGRRWETAQGAMHHLIDPRTMKPAVTDVVQCTVVGDDCAECEVYAKAVCLLGSAEGVRWLEQRAPASAGAYEALIVAADRTIAFAATGGRRTGSRFELF